MLKSIKLFISLERYAFLILLLEISAIGLEFLFWKLFGLAAIAYSIVHLPLSIYWGIRMINLFKEWPRKKRYHIATIKYFISCNEKGLPIKKSKLYQMTSPCDRITRNEICKTLKIQL